MKTFYTTLVFLFFIQLSFSVQANTFYLDPNSGSLDNPGTIDLPWPGLQEVLEANFIGTYQYDHKPYHPDSSNLVIVNEGAPVQGGDTLILREGLHGEVFLVGHYNSDFITVKAEEGEEAILERIRIKGGKNWRFENLVVSSEPYGAYLGHRLVFFETHSWHGPISKMQVLNSEIYSTEEPRSIKSEWLEKMSSGIHLTGDSSLLESNIIRNVNTGINVSGNHHSTRYNQVINFAGDGMRMLGSNIIFEGNIIKNCYDVNENHDDGIQSFVTGDHVFSNNIIRSNIILNNEEPKQALLGTLQGIGCFDGFYENWVVENNLISVNHYHGITFSGARSCRIVNNTVLDPSPEIEPGGSWIRIADHKDGRPSEDCIVSNNVANSFSVDGEMINNAVLSSHEAYDSNFLAFQAMDFHLKEGSRLIDAGASDYAPDEDIEGIDRPQGMFVDIGAYEYEFPNEILINNNEISIYPNPVNDLLHLEKVDDLKEVMIYDMNGAFILKKNLEETKTAIDLQDLKAGSYILQLVFPNARKSESMIFLKM